MHHEAVIRLEVQEREDHSLYVCSPDVPFLHVVVPTRAALNEVVPPLVKELLERNRHTKVDVRLVDVLESEHGHCGNLPAPHIIAQLSM